MTAITTNSQKTDKNKATTDVNSTDIGIRLKSAVQKLPKFTKNHAEQY